MKEIRKYWLVKIALYPLAFVYGLITDLRNYFFDSGLFKIVRFDIAVISIGNITAGGSGKTPFTMLCLELLKEHYENIVVVSRGYGRKSKGLKVVSDGHSKILTPEEGGDEPVMMARKFPDVPVIVCEKRSEAIKKAIQLFDAKMILLDDAFQHRWVARLCDIVLINASRSLKKECLLPLGDLREKTKNLKRADIVVFNQSSGQFMDKDTEFFKSLYKGPVFSSRFEPTHLINTNMQDVGSLKMLQNEKILVFSAIADPGQFQSMLMANGLSISHMILYPDHYAYPDKTLEEIAAKGREHGCKYLLTTEKDLVKIDAGYFSDFQLRAVRLRGSLNNTEEFLNKLRQFIDIKI